MSTAHKPEPEQNPSSSMQTGGMNLGDNSAVRVERDLAGRDVIQGTQVKAKKRAVAAGGDIKAPVFTGNIRDSVISIVSAIPRWLGSGVLALLAMVTIVLAGVTMIAYAVWPKPLGPMDGLFNVAIADFGQSDEAGQVQPWSDGNQLRESIRARLQAELDANPSLKGIVQVRKEEVGLVKGQTAAARNEDAGQLAKTLKAHVVIYGNLERQNGQQKFAPSFYVSELQGAEELVGPGELGTPLLACAGATNLGCNLLMSEAMQSRTQALTFFTLGLTYLTLRQPDKAIAWLDRAAEVKGWNDDEGKEVLYLFLGTGHTNRGQAEDLEQARQFYENAIRLQPEYSRAYIGLGNVAYHQFARSGQRDLGALDEALLMYEKASTAQLKPATAFVESKVHVSLGNVYVIKGQMGQLAYFDKAEQEFSSVIREYEQRDARLQPIAALAYFGMGTVYERSYQDFRKAAEFYRRCLVTVAEEDVEVKRLAETQLHVVEALLAATPTLTPTTTATPSPTSMATDTTIPSTTPSATATAILPRAVTATSTARPARVVRPTATRKPANTPTPTRTVPLPTIFVPPPATATLAAVSPSPTRTPIAPPPLPSPTRRPSPTPTAVVPNPTQVP